jgi:hypothetical protein
MVEVVPNRGTNEVALGMGKNQVRNRFGPPDTEFVRNPAVGYVEWAYESRGVYVSFDQAETCNAVMLFAAADPHLVGVPLLRVASSLVGKLLSSMDPGTVAGDEGYKSTALGLAVYAPELAYEPRRPAENVLVFRADYYRRSSRK